MTNFTLELPSNLQPQRAALKNRLQQLSVQYGDFILASGKRSSFYLDCRMTTLDAKGAYLIGQLLTPMILDANIDAVGGMTMGADPIVSAILTQSAAMGHPLQGFLVRKSAKGHGTGRQVEGHLQPWMRVAVVEDVVTTGGSTVQAIQAIQRACPSVTIAQVLALVDRHAGGPEAILQTVSGCLGFSATPQVEACRFGALYSVHEVVQERA